MNPANSLATAVVALPVSSQCVHAQHAEMGLFSSVGAYNATTTRNPIICQFAEKAHFISAVLAVGYEEVKKCVTVSMKI